jgi:hypothetical protein
MTSLVRVKPSFRMRGRGHDIPTAGTTDFTLSDMPLPAKDAASCSLNQLAVIDGKVETDDLFKRKRMKGWWPSVEVDKDGSRLLNVSITPALHTHTHTHIIHTPIIPHLLLIGKDGAGV